MSPAELLAYAQRLQAIAQAGITYAVNGYDEERYQEVRTISARLLENISEQPCEKILRAFTADVGYPTPKVDIRAVVFRHSDEVLMVSEKIDAGRWTLPGGWAEVGFTPFEVAAKEVEEETGLLVEPLRLLALFDKRKHPHPPQPWYVYKAFIQCAPRGGELKAETAETAGARWFARRDLERLELSTDRTTLSQLQAMFAFAERPELPALCD